MSVLLDTLHLKAPSRSFLSLTLTLTNGLYEGAIAITSAAGEFVVAAADPRGAIELAYILGEHLVDQLDRWKIRRFNP